MSSLDEARARSREEQAKEMRKSREALMGLVKLRERQLHDAIADHRTRAADPTLLPAQKWPHTEEPQRRLRGAQAAVEEIDARIAALTGEPIPDDAHPWRGGAR